MSEQHTERKRHILKDSHPFKGRQKLNTPTNVTGNQTGTNKLLPGVLIALLLAGLSFSLLASCSKEKEEPNQQATTESNIQETKPSIVVDQTPPAPISTEAPVEIDTNEIVPDVPGRYPLASIQLLTDTDLLDISKDELKIMRNEIYARHSYRFKNKKLLLFFNTQEWYTPHLDNVYNLLSDLEKANIAMIKKFEKK